MEKGVRMCIGWTVHFYVCIVLFFSPYTCGTYESVFLTWNIKDKG